MPRSYQTTNSAPLPLNVVFSDVQAKIQRNNLDFRVVKHDAHQYRIIDDTFIDKAHKYFSKDFRSKRAANLAQFFEDKLEAKEILTPNKAEYDKELRTIGHYKRMVKPLCHKNPALKTLSNKLTCSYLGIKPSGEINPSFMKWAKKTRVEGALSNHDHTLRVLADGDVQFVSKGHAFQNWSDVQNIALDALEKGKHFKESWRAEYYDKDGVTFKDTYVNTGEKVYQQLPPTGRFYIRVIVHAPKPGIEHNHSWIHLVNDKGEVFSFSFYREMKNDRSLGTHPGRIVHGDRADTWVRYTKDGMIDFDLGEGETGEALFEKLKQYNLNYMTTSEEDTRPRLPFNNCDHNCTDWAISMLKMAGAENIPENYKLKFWDVYAPKSVIKAVKWTHTKVPTKVSNIGLKVIAFVGNSIMLYFNSHKVDRAYPDIKPRISCFKDMFNEKNLEFTSPYYFNQNIIKEAHEWRKQESVRIQNDDSFNEEEKRQKIAMLAYQLPSRWMSASAAA